MPSLYEYKLTMHSALLLYFIIWLEGYLAHSQSSHIWREWGHWLPALAAGLVCWIAARAVEGLSLNRLLLVFDARFAGCCAFSVTAMVVSANHVVLGGRQSTFKLIMSVVSGAPHLQKLVIEGALVKSVIPTITSNSPKMI